MTSSHPAGPIPLPDGAQIVIVTARVLTILSPTPVPAGSLMEFDILLGARPLAAMARVVGCGPSDAPGKHAVACELVAMAQLDRDTFTDFLQAVGSAAIRVRQHRDEL